MKILKTALAYVLAVLATTVLGAIAATQFVLADLSTMKVMVPFGVRLDTTLHDIVGMSPTFTPIVASALLVAFLVAALFTRVIPLPKRRWYLVGGFVAIIAALLLIKTLLGGTPIAGAKDTLGLLAQGVAGMVGGWVFAQLLPQQELKS